MVGQIFGTVLIVWLLRNDGQRRALALDIGGDIAHGSQARGMRVSAAPAFGIFRLYFCDALCRLVQPRESLFCKIGVARQRRGLGSLWVSGNRKGAGNAVV